MAPLGKKGMGSATPVAKTCFFVVVLLLLGFPDWFVVVLLLLPGCLMQNLA